MTSCGLPGFAQKCLFTTWIYSWRESMLGVYSPTLRTLRTA